MTMARSETVPLRFEKVSKGFDRGKGRVHALKNVSLRLRPARITGLVGPDGSGKTTLMRLAAGLLEADEGDIFVLGIDARRDPLKVQSGVGYMPQGFGLYEDLSVEENLELFADLQGVPRRDRPARYRELANLTQLGDFMSRLAGRLSGGMQQKLGLACTLIRSPEILLLDEATVGVDPVSRRELWRIIGRLVEKENKTVLLSTAYLDEAENCHDLVLLHQGEILGRGEPGQFTQKLQGRTFHVAAASPKRRLQALLANDQRVMDAVIQGEGVRVVTDDETVPELDLEEARIEKVPPRFEDAYVDMLSSQKENREQRADEAPASPTEQDAEAVIQVEDLQRRFGDFFAVKGVSFQIQKGEVFGLLGANGAGKTTTFRMLCGLLPASGGRVRVAGLDLRKAAARARSRIGYMSQKFSLYGSLSVRQNLNFFSRVYGLQGAGRKDRIRWALDSFELKSLAGTDSQDLPLGYKQRLSLACALMHRPEILFLDEPTSGVDPMARRQFWNHINRLANQGVTVLVTTHFMEEAEYCDRLAIMVAGEILAAGRPAEIKEKAGGSKEKGVQTLEEAFVDLLEEKENGTAP
jgi:ABC-2 type transport system ATP-binding protein